MRKVNGRILLSRRKWMKYHLEATQCHRLPIYGKKEKKKCHRLLEIKCMLHLYVFEGQQKMVSNMNQIYI